MLDGNRGYRFRNGALIGSVILNLFLGALAGGHYLRQHAESGERATALAQIMHTITARLPPKDAETFRATLHAEAPRYARSREGLVAARENLDRQLMAQQFDATATRDAMHNWQTAWDAFITDLRDPLIDALSHLSPQGRRALVSVPPHNRNDVSSR